MKLKLFCYLCLLYFTCLIQAKRVKSEIGLNQPVKRFFGGAKSKKNSTMSKSKTGKIIDIVSNSDIFKTNQNPQVNTQKKFSQDIQGQKLNKVDETNAPIYILPTTIKPNLNTKGKEGNKWPFFEFKTNDPNGNMETLSRNLDPSVKYTSATPQSVLETLPNNNYIDISGVDSTNNYYLLRPADMVSNDNELFPPPGETRNIHNFIPKTGRGTVLNGILEDFNFEDLKK